MKTLRHIVGIALLLGTANAWSSETASLFPEPNEIQTGQRPSLASALSQFEGILEGARTGDMEVLRTNDQYNETRRLRLQRELEQKQAYVKSMPDLIGARFDSLMQQYPQADQKTKNRVARTLHDQWQLKEEQAKQEIVELQAQLASTEGRLSDSALKRETIEISRALFSEAPILAGQSKKKAISPDQESEAYQTMMSLSTRRTLSKINEFCTMHVTALDTQLSLGYLDH